MASWGMATYLYAPKDDEKHRNEWRELYSLEEAGTYVRTVSLAYCVCTLHRVKSVHNTVYEALGL